MSDRCTDEVLCQEGARIFLEFNASKQWSAEYTQKQAEYIEHARKCRVHGGALPTCYPQYVGVKSAKMLLGIDSKE